MDGTQPPNLASTITIPPWTEPAGEKTGDVIGRYKLLEKIGEGGMGSVWVAEQTQEIHRKVALKVIKLGMDTKQVIARFEAERQALALMDHPSIARVLDAGATENGRPFFAMELVNGIPITDYCDQHQLPTGERLALFTKVCKAVQHAHQRGVVHRDIKPQNILVTFQDGAPVPKIIDFGIAKALAGQHLTDKTVHTRLEEFIGTPAYMSPEQAEMNALGIDARSDVYSLGVLLYELLTGLTPFKAWLLRQLSTAEIRRIIREEEPPRPSASLTTLLSAGEQATVAKHRSCGLPALVHSVRGDLDWIVMKCLEKDRTSRYGTPDELAGDVQRHLENQPVLAHAPSPVERLTKLMRRRKRTIATVAAIVIFTPLLAFVYVSLWPAKPPPGLSIEQRLQRADLLLRDYDQEGKITEALALLRDSPANEPPNAGIWAIRGWANWLLYRENDREEARWEAGNCASNAMRLNPENAQGHLVQGLVARSLGDSDSATNHLFRAKELTRSSDGLVLICLASALRAAKDKTNALVYAQLAEQAAEDRWDIWDKIGRYWVEARPRTNDLERSRSSFERAVRLAPNSPMAHLHLGDLLLRQRLAQEALPELERSAQLRRTPEALSAIGTAYLRLRKYETAADYFLQASRADPEKFIYHYSAGVAFRANTNAQAQAAEQFTQAVRQMDDLLTPGHEKALVRAYRGACLAALDRPAEARQDLEQARREAGLDMEVLAIVLNGYKLLRDAKQISEIQKLMSGIDDSAGP
jgi:serine/threonine protein kinase/predicted Zn-dependent protease